MYSSDSAHIFGAGGGAVSAIAIATIMTISAVALSSEARAADDEQPSMVGIPDIIVTARKQDESLQKVPVSISAYTAEQIAKQRLYDIKDLQSSTPGLFSGGDADLAILIIRGIAARPPRIGGDPAVGQYIDEVYQPRFSNTLSSLFEPERIEVLKGPQGTVFGRNTTSGAINIVSKKPKDELEASLMAGLGNNNLFETRGTVSGPLVKGKLAGGISFFARKDTGYIDVINATGRKIGDNGNSDYGYRGALRWTPTENLTIDLSGMRLRTESAEILGCKSNPCGPVSPLFLRLSGPFGSLPGAFAPSKDAGDALNFKVAATKDGSMVRDNRQFTGRIDWNVSDTIQLTSLTAYIDYKFRLISDLDNELQDISTKYADESAKTFSQEIRGTVKSGMLKLTIGGNYYNDKDKIFQNFDIYGLKPASSPGNVPYITFGHVTTTSWAAFGQAFIEPMRGLVFGGGIRYSHDKRDYRSIFQPNFANYGEAFDSDLVPGWDTSPAWHATTYELTAKYEINDDVMVYARHATGYRAGGLQGIGQVQNIAQASANYDPEHVQQQEIGLKGKFFDRRLLVNAAYYHTKLKDAQVSASSSSFFFGPVILNAGKAKVDGAELSVEALLTKGIRLDLGYAYTDARYTDYLYTDDIPAAIAAQTARFGCLNPNAYGCHFNDYVFTGTSAEFSPKHTLSVALSFDIETAAGGLFNLRVEDSWRSKYQLDVLPVSVASLSDSFKEANLLQQKGFNLLNMSSSYMFPNKQWSVTVWAKNVLDKHYVVLGESPVNVINGSGQRVIMGAPRTYGLSASFRY